MNADVFAAVADPTRRHLLEQLIRTGKSTATELAAQLTISRQAVAKHLKILNQSGLTTSRRQGRETIFEPRPESLTVLTDWVNAASADWAERLDRLAKASED